MSRPMRFDAKGRVQFLDVPIPHKTTTAGEKIVDLDRHPLGRDFAIAEAAARHPEREDIVNAWRFGRRGTHLKIPYPADGLGLATQPARKSKR